MTTTQRLPVTLTDEQIGDFGCGMDKICDEAVALPGDQGRANILNLITIQLSMVFSGRMNIYAGLFFLPKSPHELAGWTATLLFMGPGVVRLGAAKMRENIESSHNVLRALAARYGLPYNTVVYWRQFGTIWRGNLRLSFRGGLPLPPVVTA